MRRSLSIAAATGIWLVAGLFWVPEASAADAEFTVKQTVIDDHKAVFATVESVDQISARARIGGTVSNLTVDEGSKVERDQVIARVEDPKLRLQMAATEARIQSLQAQRKLAKTELDRARELRSRGTISQARLDEAQTNLDVVDKNLAALQAERQVIVEQRAEGAVKAPAAGRVLKVNVTDGAVILAGETVARIAIETYILRMYLPERHARFIHVGDDVMVGRRGLEPAAAVGTGNTDTGRIRQVYPELSQGRVVADVDVDGLGNYYVGERVLVFVSTGQRSTFVVPPEYVFHRFGLSYVKLSDGDEAVVQPGLPVEGGIEILSGVHAGDRLVLPESGR